MADTSLIRCPSCGATNRVPAAQLRPGRHAICGRCKTTLPPRAEPLTVTDASFAELVERAALPVLLDLWAPWCGPCHMVAPAVEALSTELAGRAVVGKLNIDDNPATASRYQVRSIPTLLILRGGREIDRIVGVVPKEEIARRLEWAISERASDVG